MAVLGWVRFGDGAEALQHLTLTQGYFPRDGSHFVFSSGLGQAWTLVVEVSFYAFVPGWAWTMRRLAVAGRVDPFRQEVAGALMLFAAGVGAATIVAARPLPVPFGVLPTHLTSLSWGMLLAVVATRLPRGTRRSDPEPAWVAAEGDVTHLSVSPGLAEVIGAAPAPAPPRRRIGVPEVPGWLRRSATEVSWLAAWGVMLLGCLRLDELSAEPGHVRLVQVVNFAAGVLLVTPVLLGAPGRGWVRWLLTWRPVVFLGVVSYGVYLWHLDVFVDLPGPWEPEPVGPGLAGMLAKAAVALAAGVTSFYLLERPLMRWADRRTRRVPAPVLRHVPVRHDVPVGVE
jgi:peptidoglycan/LPS O-acetylase OafA/YrhL